MPREVGGELFSVRGTWYGRLAGVKEKRGNGNGWMEGRKEGSMSRYRLMRCCRIAAGNTLLLLLLLMI